MSTALQKPKPPSTSSRTPPKEVWQNISHLGVFLWRLNSFAPGISTPVAGTKCPGQFSFDPTGRQIPLFAAASRNSTSYGDNWVSPQEWQLPGEISLELMQLALNRKSTRLNSSHLGISYAVF